MIDRGQKVNKNILPKSGSYFSTLSDLFDSIYEDKDVYEHIKILIYKKQSIQILLEGSSYIENISVIDDFLARRLNEQDSLILIDKDPLVVEKHAQHIKKNYPEKNYKVTFGDMNELPFENSSFDLIINNFTVNFNIYERDDEKTISEIRRLLKPKQSICLFSVGVRRDYDDIKYGKDQELLTARQINDPGFFYVPSNKEIRRICLSVPYYTRLFDKYNFYHVKFDVENGKNLFLKETNISYRRFVLIPNKSKKQYGRYNHN